MSRIKKIVKIVLIFIAVIMLISILYSIYKVVKCDIELSQTLNETFKCFLYIIGYGDAIDSESRISQNIFAIIGITSIALMTTFLTLNLFWRSDDISISKKIAIWKKRDKFYASILFLNKGNNISDLKASFITYDINGNLIYKDDLEHTYPLLIKNSYWRFDVSLEDEFWYKTLKKMINETIDAYIYLTFSFADVKNGQVSLKVMKYGLKDIIGIKNINKFSIANEKNINNNILLELQENTFNYIDQFDISKLESIVCDEVYFKGKDDPRATVDFSYNKEENCEDIKINFCNGIKKYDYVEIYLNLDNYEKYCSKNTIFRCEFSGNEGIKSIDLKVFSNSKNIIGRTLEVKNEPTIYELNFNLDYLKKSEDDEEILTKIDKIVFKIMYTDMLKEEALLKLYKIEIDNKNI